MSGALRNRSDSTRYFGERPRNPNGDGGPRVDWAEVKVFWANGAGDVATLDHRRSLSLHNHSPSGFEWGYGGSGPAQLALAILYHFTRRGRLSLRHHQQFKTDYVCGWADNWQITGGEIRAWLGRQVVHAALVKAQRAGRFEVLTPRPGAVGGVR